MAKFWYKRIKAGKAELKDVPRLWRDDVEKMLGDNE